MLDVRNLAVGLQGRYFPGDTSTSLQPLPREEPDSDALPTRFLKPIDLSSGRAVISLQDMINTTVALRSNIDLEVIHPTSQWPSSVFSTTSTMAPEEGEPVPLLSNQDQDPNALHVAQAISGLQREILLLRNDLNFELWLSRENAKHIGRLYQDRILMKTAETERQGLVGNERRFVFHAYSCAFLLVQQATRLSHASNKSCKRITRAQATSVECEKQVCRLDGGTTKEAERASRRKEELDCRGREFAPGGKRCEGKSQFVFEEYVGC